ncbi:13296_t:CDS:2 [Ambispora leptoticha]|uniref:13296_t:CDS:1 n=1 Tax=Ambispora leptoticha TaxID=144679 RepID=A0A9N9F0K2_9GLOM|nr:13296_t:CDS:2 [Ambispora leptoticha]
MPPLNAADACIKKAEELSDKLIKKSEEASTLYNYIIHIKNLTISELVKHYHNHIPSISINNFPSLGSIDDIPNQINAYRESESSNQKDSSLGSMDSNNDQSQTNVYEFEDSFLSGQKEPFQSSMYNNDDQNQNDESYFTSGQKDPFPSNIDRQN